MGWIVKTVLVFLVVGLTLLGIHSEHLGLGPGDRQVYAISVSSKLLVMTILVLVVLVLRQRAMRNLLLVSVGAVWLLQQQTISTSSITVPPEVSVWIVGIVRIDTAHVCINQSGDDVFAVEGTSITKALKTLSFADASCNSRGSPRYIELPLLATFAPANDDPMRSRISGAIDRILGVS